MEVGAVKQAFNNEVILLKKNLNQAKIQIIHKLTRKAKQLAEKKAPESLKEKFKRKAESAVNEVLIIKKIKPRDLAQFIVTHKGELNTYLNKPTVDNDKACACLLLHKALQDKYKFIRGRFSNVPIKDLFMSRLERKKMKKEEKEKQKNKKQRKANRVVNSEGDWNVEDVQRGNKEELSAGGDDEEGDLSDRDDEEEDLSDRDDEKGDLSERDDKEEHLSDRDDEERDLSNRDDEERNLSDVDDGSNDNNAEIKENGSQIEESEHSEEENISDNNNDKVSDDQANLSKSEDEAEPEIEVPITVVNNGTKSKPNLSKRQNTLTIDKALAKEVNIKPREANKKKQVKKQKDVNKNRNFNDKIQQRKFKKESDAPVASNKIVDPFFITFTGEKYMSVVEPRGPDEVKEEHRYGNRKLRRAAMFGHVLKVKPRNESNYGDDNTFNKQNGSEQDSNFRSKFNNKQDFNDRKGFNNDKKSFSNSFNDSKGFNDKVNDEKPEKLHPSWEAKKKKSGILPFEGKKIVFD